MTEGAENVARALFYDSEEPLNLTGELSYELRGYRVRGGLTAGVNVQVHPDPRVQQVLEQIRESESQQAIDRLRFIHGKGGRQVYLLSNLVLDVTVDSLLSWTDLMAGGTKLERAWEASEGVLPLSPVWLTENFSGLFKSENVAKSELKSFVEMGGILNNISIKDLTHLSYYEYRFSKQPGKARNCISQYALKETKLKLKTKFGKEVVAIKLIQPPASFSLADVKNELY